MVLSALYDKEAKFMDLFNKKLKHYLTHVNCYGMGVRGCHQPPPTTNMYIEFPLWANKKEGTILYRLQFLFRVAYMYEEGLQLIHYPGPGDAVDFFGAKLVLTEDELQVCQTTKSNYEFAIEELERIINTTTPAIEPFSKKSCKWVYSSWTDVEEDD